MAVLRNSTTTRRLALWLLAFLLVVLLLRTPTTKVSSYIFGRPRESLLQEKPLSDSQQNTIAPPSNLDHGTTSIPDPPSQEPPADASPEYSEHPGSSPRSRLNLDYQEYLDWEPPVEYENHYPGYGDYHNRDYDPNRWEAFEQNNGIYTNATLDRRPATGPRIYSPYPDYNGDAWRRTWRGRFEACEGPSGLPFNETGADMIMAYSGIPGGFPKPAAGSYEAVGLDDSVCFDRFSRLGAYGLIDSTATQDSAPVSKVDWGVVKWGQLQNACLERNGDRYARSEAPVLAPGKTRVDDTQDAEKAKEDVRERQVAAIGSGAAPALKSRTAVLIRAWDTYAYQENDLQAIRSLITELSLQSGGEYHVFLFVNVKDLDNPLFDSAAAYQEAMDMFVPKEFQSIAILWTEKVCQEWYPRAGEWSVYFQQFMSLQWFSKTHPEFDYVWNWEMDARYIGQTYHFVETIANFSKAQPRKHLWERNSRYYIPEAHGDWSAFSNDTSHIVETSPQINPVWGPQPWTVEQKPLGPEPPTSEADDKFTWGVGEEADFITLLPIWDPRNTWWAYRDKLFNYPEAQPVNPDRPYSQVPRRVFINTLVRFSAKLLDAMHWENSAGFGMASEMWPASVALQHGFKAVYAPHPIWTSHVWPAEYLDSVVNADGWGAGSLPPGNIDDGRGVAFDPERAEHGQGQVGTGPNGEGRAGQWSQERDSVYNPDREHNFGGWSWYFWSDFPRVVYRRWLGWNAQFNFVTFTGVRSDDELGSVNWKEYEQEHGRICFPAMLLHPVKNVTEANDLRS